MPKKKKNETRFIPLKNYYIAVLVLIFIIFITLYIFKWYEVKQSEKYLESYLISSETITMEINEEDEMKQVFLEAPEKYFVYIGYRKDASVYNLEKELKPIIDDYNLKDIFYYVDATDLMNDGNHLKMFNNTLNLKKEKIAAIPTIIYFNEKGYSIIKEKNDKILKASTFKKYLEDELFEKTAN